MLIVNSRKQETGKSLYSSGDFLEAWQKTSSLSTIIKILIKVLAYENQEVKYKDLNLVY